MTQEMGRLRALFRKSLNSNICLTLEESTEPTLRSKASFSAEYGDAYFSSYLALKSVMVDCSCAARRDRGRFLLRTLAHHRTQWDGQGQRAGCLHRV
jgi:hypothetical protein